METNSPKTLNDKNNEGDVNFFSKYSLSKKYQYWTEHKTETNNKENDNLLNIRHSLKVSILNCISRLKWTMTETLIFFKNISCIQEVIICFSFFI